MDFGTWLERELQEKDWTIHHLAMKAGVPQSTITRIIQEHRNPRIDTVEKLQLALGVRYPGDEVPDLRVGRSRGVTKEVMEKAAEISEGVVANVETWELLTEEQKELVRDLVEALAEKQKDEKSE